MQELKTYTLVIGASENPERYSNKAIISLRRHGFLVHAIGLRPGKVLDVTFQTGQPVFTDIDTVTLYLSLRNQEPMIDYVLSLSPRRIIFNPGTENPYFEDRAKAKGIVVEEACTLVLLSLAQY